MSRQQWVEHPLATRTVAEDMRLEDRRKVAEKGGAGPQSGMATDFPKNPPPRGMAYSKNFARAQKAGRFALQVK